MCSRWWGVFLARLLIWGLTAAFPASHSIRAQEPIPRQIVVRVSGDLLAPRFERPIDEMVPVDEMILGARAIGDAHVIGQPRLILADDPQSAAFVIALSGTIESRTIGYKGTIEIHGRSQTQFTATKRVVYVPERGFVAQAAQIDAQTDHQTDRIVPDRGGLLGRMMERRGWNRVNQTRRQVSQIVQNLSETKIGEAFDRLLDERLAGVNRLVDQRYLVAAALRGQPTPHYTCCTSQGSLIVAASSGAKVPNSQLPTDIMAHGRSGPPVQVWIHESVMGDRTAVALRTIDLFRHLVGSANFTTSQPIAASASPSATGRRYYDFAAIGDWIVVHSGRMRAATVPVATDAEQHVGGGP